MLLLWTARIHGRAAAPLLGFAPLPAVYFAWLAALLLTYLLAVEAAKQWFYKRRAG